MVADTDDEEGKAMAIGFTTNSAGYTTRPTSLKTPRVRCGRSGTSRYGQGL